MNKTVTKRFNEAFAAHRKLSIPTIQGIDCIGIIHETLDGIDGIQQVIIDVYHKQIWITYDAAQIGFGEIERLLSECRYPVSNSWWSRYKSAWYRYLDENARENAQSKAGPCCSNPSDIYAKRHK